MPNANYTQEKQVSTSSKLRTRLPALTAIHALSTAIPPETAPAPSLKFSVLELEQCLMLDFLATDTVQLNSYKYLYCTDYYNCSIVCVLDFKIYLFKIILDISCKICHEYILFSVVRTVNYRAHVIVIAACISLCLQ